jgi:hypothetical protein
MNPRKDYTCYVCKQPIEGEHIYISSKYEDFWTGREHIECNAAADAMCNACPDAGACQADHSECFAEMKHDQQEGEA